jgi:hypothetical protein
MNLNPGNLNLTKLNLTKLKLPTTTSPFNLNGIKKRWGINRIVLTGFVIFTIFFLYNCKYGIFKSASVNFDLHHFN